MKENNLKNQLHVDDLILLSIKRMGINGEGISSDEVDSRIQHAREKLKIAHQAYDNL